MPKPTNKTEEYDDGMANLIELFHQCQSLLASSGRVMARIEEGRQRRRKHALLLATGQYRERTDVRYGRGGQPADLWRITKKEKAQCGAKTRKGTPCQMRVTPGTDRCRLNGGLSTGPKTAEGRARISEANRRRWAAKRVADA